MYCPNCGVQVTEGAKFCSKCGMALGVEKKERNQYKEANKSLVMLMLAVVLDVVLLGTLFLPLVSVYGQYGKLEDVANMPKYLKWAMVDECSFSYDIEYIVKDKGASYKTYHQEYWEGNGIISYLCNYYKYEEVDFSDDSIAVTIIFGILALMSWISGICYIIYFLLGILKDKEYSFSTLKQLIIHVMIYVISFIIHMSMLRKTLGSIVYRECSFVTNYSSLWKTCAVLIFLLALYFLYFKSIENPAKEHL